MEETESTTAKRVPFQAQKAKVRFSGRFIEKAACPPAKTQEIYWDVDCRGLGLRVTRTGFKAYVFQGLYRGKDVRVTIGRPGAWPIPEAQRRARELQRMIDNGRDPRDLRREADAEHAKRVAEEAAKSLTVKMAWDDYLQRGRPPGRKRTKWSDRYKADLEKVATPGGEPKKRGKGLTRSGPLYPLLSLPLMAIDDDVQKDWFDEEEDTSGLTQATRAFRMFQGFINWCASEPKYKRFIQGSAIAPASVTRYLGGANARNDVLQRGQLRAWWDAVCKLENRVVSVYLRVLVLTGARRQQMAALETANVDFRWKSILFKDKVYGERKIPLTPYVEHMLQSIKTDGQFVFAADTESGYIADPSSALATANKAAGVEVSPHGLRRTFRTLSHWIQPPVEMGVVAQIIGHRPSGTEEKHYIVRDLEFLTQEHTRIEAWFLQEAGVDWSPERAARKSGELYLVGGQVMVA